MMLMLKRFHKMHCARVALFKSLCIFCDCVCILCMYCKDWFRWEISTDVSIICSWSMIIIMRTGVKVFVCCFFFISHSINENKLNQFNKCCAVFHLLEENFINLASILKLASLQWWLELMFVCHFSKILVKINVYS